jgi:hypothetical protein
LTEIDSRIDYEIKLLPATSLVGVAGLTGGLFVPKAAAGRVMQGDHTPWSDNGGRELPQMSA